MSIYIMYHFHLHIESFSSNIVIVKYHTVALLWVLALQIEIEYEYENLHQGEDSFTRKVENWRNVLKSFCEKSFKKIRLKKAKTKPISGALKVLFNERNNILKKKRFDNFNCPTCDSECRTMENLDEHMPVKHGKYLHEYEALLEKVLDELNIKIADQEAKESRETSWG